MTQAQVNRILGTPTFDASPSLHYASHVHEPLGVVVNYHVRRVDKDGTVSIVLIVESVERTGFP
jgi:hypothetical protein